MATAIFFGGRRINKPGAYSEIDASALAGLSPGAVGIVALIGEAEGGKPLTVDTTFSDFTSSNSMLQTYRAGDLRTAGQFAFAPSNDEAIPGGAQRIIAVKVNPAVQSSVTLSDASASDAVDLTSRDWGLFTAQINVEVAAGTLQGKLITVTFEDTIETFDNVGGDAAFDVLFTPGAEGYDTMTALVTASSFTASATKANTGLAAEVTAAVPAGLPAAMEAVSSAAGDTSQSLTLYGLAGGVAVQETISLNGTTAVPTALATWSHVLGAVLSAAAVGTITIRVAGGGATAISLAPAALTAGVVQVTNGTAAGVLTTSIDTDTAIDVAMFGLNAAGTRVGEVFDMTAGNTTPVVGSQVFSDVQIMALGEAAAARTITISLTAASTLHSVYTTVQKTTDRLNALAGFSATPLASNATSLLMTLLDFPTTPSDLLTPAAEFLADLNAFITAVNNGSGLISAARSTGASAVPDNTSSPVFLAGGGEGTTTISQWQAAFTLLKQRRANIIVPLTRDPAVHSLLVTHLKERAGALRSEANGYVGIGTADGAGETKANIKSQIQVLGTRHVTALSEEPRRFDPDTGINTWYPPHMYAAIAAGMQAGSPIGEPLTFKRPGITDVRRDSSWNPIDDGEELIDAGLMFSELKDGEGIRFVRSITTHLSDDNVVFTEMSANESANAAVYELRTQLERRIGRRGLVGTVAAIKGLANDVLSRLIDDEIIFGYRSLEVEQVGDVFPVSVEIAPILPINFIPITVHLVAARAAA